MKKRLVLLLMTGAMIISGCQNKEKKSETVDSLATEQSVEEQSEAASKEDVYKEQMELIHQALVQGWSADQCLENQISSLISNNYEGNTLENVGYALKDLDGDGTEELIISAVSKDSSGGMIYDVYSAVNGKVVHVLSGHERNRYYLQLMEEGGYMIANEASNSAFNSAWYYYCLTSGRLELIQGVVFDAEADEKNPWFITYDEDWDVSNDDHDVEGMAESIIDSYTKNYTTLEYTSFSEYDIR